MAINLSLPDTYTTATLAAGLLAAYCFAGVIYRLQFHPLAKFPGPRLAAATLWYEFFYDCILYGQYTFKIGRMHEKYGGSHILRTQWWFELILQKALSSELAQMNFTAMILTLSGHCKLNSYQIRSGSDRCLDMLEVELAGTSPNFTATPELCQGPQSLPLVTM